MFFAFFGKKNQEESKIQELERTIQELTNEVDSLKRIISEIEMKLEEVIEEKNTQILRKGKNKLSLLDIKILSSKETYYSGEKAVVYKIDHGVLRSNIISIIQFFQKEYVKMGECHVSTFSESGSSCDCTFRNIDDLEELESFPSPYMSFYIDFLDVFTDEYRYSMKCSSNNNRVFIYTKSTKNNESK